MAVTCTRRFVFDAAHRILGHGGKCRNLHGHRYIAEITVQAEVLNGLGMVLDFGVIKERIGKWIDDNWDHNVILNRKDPLLDLPSENKWDFEVRFGNRRPFLMPGEDCEPTAENIATYLLVEASSLLEDQSIWVTHIRLWETENCYVDVYAPEYLRETKTKPESSSGP